MNIKACMLQQLIALSAIPSPTGMTDQASEYVMKELNRLGFRCKAEEGGAAGLRRLTTTRQMNAADKQITVPDFTGSIYSGACRLRSGSFLRFFYRMCYSLQHF